MIRIIIKIVLVLFVAIPVIVFFSLFEVMTYDPNLRFENIEVVDAYRVDSERSFFTLDDGPAFSGDYIIDWPAKLVMALNATKYEFRTSLFAIRIEDQLVGVKIDDGVKSEDTTLFFENRVKITNSLTGKSFLVVNDGK